MSSRIDTELAMNALLMAVWRRKPADPVMVHADQGSQFSSKDWRDFLTAHRLTPSMSRRGNCHDNAVAESFFQLLKRERIKRTTYATRDDARQAGRISSTTSRCSTIPSAVTVLMTAFCQQSLSEGILKGSRVSGRLVAV